MHSSFSQYGCSNQADILLLDNGFSNYRSFYFLTNNYVYRKCCDSMSICQRRDPFSGPMVPKKRLEKMYINLCMLLSLCSPKASAKVTWPIMLKCSQNLNFEPKKVLDKFFGNFLKSIPILAKNFFFFKSHIVYFWQCALWASSKGITSRLEF